MLPWLSGLLLAQPDRDEWREKVREAFDYYRSKGLDSRGCGICLNLFGALESADESFPDAWADDVEWFVDSVSALREEDEDLLPALVELADRLRGDEE